MSKKAAVPDAWDDDWEDQADRLATEEDVEPAIQAPLSKAERRAQHEDTNRRLWESADSPETFHFVEANNKVPIASAFKPAVKVLSRKPAPQLIARKDPTTGMSQLTLEDDDEEETDKKEQLSPEEIRAKQQREREEKQRRYDEARAKIFGEPKASSTPSTPGTVTPPRSNDGYSSPRGRGRGRGGRRNNNDGRENDGRRMTKQSGTRELYDPNSAPQPVTIQRRGDADQQALDSAAVAAAPPSQVLREPKGPDGSGRGGFGFASRGGKAA